MRTINVFYCETGIELASGKEAGPAKHARKRIRKGR